MGSVWLAEQTEPVRRQVALKVIKAGMDSAQVVARFEAERQALALMDHPTIATVFDGGTTPQGRPYFAMEYVKGEPITVYCDRHLLNTRAQQAEQSGDSPCCHKNRCPLRDLGQAREGQGVASEAGGCEHTGRTGQEVTLPTR
jgi:serine/threonine protein kinase